MIRVILFDIDGTLIRTGGAGVRAFERTAATEFDRPDGLRGMHFAGRTDTSLVREFFTRQGIAATPENVRRFFDRYVFWLDHLLPQMAGGICPGVRSLLAELAALPRPPLLGLQTGNIRLGAEIKLRHFGLWGWFGVGGFGDDHEDRRELARVALRRAARRLDAPLDPREVLVVGDTPHDIDCARAVGARVLAVATGGTPGEQLAAHLPDYLVEDLSRVRAAELVSAA